MTFNIDLALDVLVKITTDRAHWNQGTWGRTVGQVSDPVVDDTGTVLGTGWCGSSFCFAGWALTMKDVPLLWFRVTATEYIAHYVEGYTSVPNAAAEQLGIVAEQCCAEHEEDVCPVEDDCLWDHSEQFPKLFSADNDYDALVEYVARHAGLTEEEVEAAVAQRIVDRTAALQGDLL